MTYFRFVVLGCAVLTSIATSTATPVWTDSDGHAQAVTVSGSQDVAWLTNVGALARDFWNTDSLYVEATTAGVGGTFMLEVTAGGVTRSDTVQLTGGTPTTARVDLADLVPSCTDWSWGCRNDVAIHMTSTIPVEVDLMGEFLVSGDSPGEALPAVLVELLSAP